MAAMQTATPTWSMAATTGLKEITIGEVALKISVEATGAEAFAGPTLVYMVTQEDAKALPLPDAQKEEFEGKDGQVATAYDLEGFNASRVLLVGLGEKEKMTARTFRVAATTVVKELKARKMTAAGVAVPDVELDDGLSAAGLVAQHAILSDYFYDYGIMDDDRCLHVQDLTLLTSTPAATVDEYVTLATSTCITRDLLNTRADIATTDWMADKALELCAKFPSIETRVVDMEEIKAKGMNLIRAVGGGAAHEPKIVYMHYKGDPDSDKTMGVVGKGLVFDCGGLNLKPTGSIENMHMDKGGACSVLGLMHALAATGVRANVVGVVALAENAIGKDACKPHEILKSYKGLTVQNMNTDAEGRLVLADAMTYLQKEYTIDTMFTVATLTGAILVSLGHYAAGMFTDDDSTAAALTAASIPADERVWRMPTYSEFSDQLKGTMCDVHSMGNNRFAGSCTAAAFLAKFAEEGVGYTHLDIAGVAGDLMGADDRPWAVKGATGWGPNILYHYIKNERAA
jgi:leucyl aminopeptidase